MEGREGRQGLHLETPAMDSGKSSARGASPRPKPKPIMKNLKAEHYFFGPRDLAHHSKIPIFFRVYGSVLPSLLIPLCFVAIWSTIWTMLFRDYIKKHVMDSILITVLGFLVGIAISFRNTTAYERYNEGRKYWAQLHLTTTNLARIIWVHAKEREGSRKEDLLAKVTVCNLLVTFSKALKHRLRFEPYIDYDDLRGYADYLDTYAKTAGVGINLAPKKSSKLKEAGEILGFSFCKDNPRSEVKNAKKELGNLPMEILVHIQAYMDSIIDAGMLKAPIYQMQSITALQNLTDILTGTERILNTPLPIAYIITIKQISWAYILLLPMQLVTKLEWYTPLAVELAAYVILGFSAIGTEIENPFGNEVNDLPLDSFCTQIEHDIDVIISHTPLKAAQFISSAENMPLYPVFMASYREWMGRSEADIREGLRMKLNAKEGETPTTEEFKSAHRQV